MDQLTGAIYAVLAIVAAVLFMLLGDYLGNKVGRKPLATVVIIIALGSIVIFTVFAAVVLLFG